MRNRVKSGEQAEFIFQCVLRPLSTANRLKSGMIDRQRI